MSDGEKGLDLGGRITRCSKCGASFQWDSAFWTLGAPDCPQCGHDNRANTRKWWKRGGYRRPLEGEDEQLAKRLLTLQQQRGVSSAESEIRNIGQLLIEDGGTERITRVALRFEAIGGRLNALGASWRGILP